MRILVFFLATAAFAQTPPPDTQALQALVSEIRQMRIDMQSTTIATQRVQIVLYRLQSQTTLVTRANSHLEDMRSSLANTQSQKTNVNSNFQRVEEGLRTTQNQVERKALEEIFPRVKAEVERVNADEERLQSRVIDAESQYRAEQAKLAALQDQLDRLDKVLDELGRK